MKCIMVQGTMSGVGKSLIAAGLCRVFRQDGYRVAPFKSQNMALNSYITKDGLEMSRAQAIQAMAAGVEPDVRMNPILLKPSSDTGSQVIVHGEVWGDYEARAYFSRKKELIPEILSNWRSLAEEYDILVAEGAGSPAEINLKEDDIVNMGLADMVNAPVLLVGDIDRGGVFAQLAGTVDLLEVHERERIIGMIINKFRGDVSLLRPGLSMLEEKTGIPVLGVLPMTQVDIDEEDSLASRLNQVRPHALVDLAVIRFPRISNFTDFMPLERHEILGVRYVADPSQLGNPDMILLPGTKSTAKDLLWLRQNGLEAMIRRMAGRGVPVLGICGGFQMLGEAIHDPFGVEGGDVSGMGLLPCETVFLQEKTRTRVSGTVTAEPFAGAEVDAYEIHMGRTEQKTGRAFCRLSDGKEDGAVSGSVFGTYLHGLFDSGALTDRLAGWLLSKKGLDGWSGGVESHRDYLERQFDRWADVLRANIDIPALYREMERFQGMEGGNAHAEAVFTGRD